MAGFFFFKADDHSILWGLLHRTSLPFLQDWSNKAAKTRGSRRFKTVRVRHHLTSTNRPTPSLKPSKSTARWSQPPACLSSSTPRTPAPRRSTLAKFTRTGHAPPSWGEALLIRLFARRPAVSAPERAIPPTRRASLRVDVIYPTPSGHGPLPSSL